jgi:hypothetical protein
MHLRGNNVTKKKFMLKEKRNWLTRIYARIIRILTVKTNKCHSQRHIS